MYRIIRTHEQLNVNKKERENEFLTIMFVLGVAIGQFKRNADTLFEMLITKSDIKLSANLFEGNSDFVEIKNQLTQNKNKSHILDFKGWLFAKYIPFIRRFSFVSDNFHLKDEL